MPKPAAARSAPALRRPRHRQRPLAAALSSVPLALAAVALVAPAAAGEPAPEPPPADRCAGDPAAAAELTAIGGLQWSCSPGRPCQEEIGERLAALAAAHPDDVERLEAAELADDPRWWQARVDGWERLGDTARRDAAIAGAADAFPCGRQAEERFDPRVAALTGGENTVLVAGVPPERVAEVERLAREAPAEGGR